MSLENTNKVDSIGIEIDTGHAVLTIADSWDWTDEKRHLLALQAKINAYFEFIETGQIWETYPSAVGKRLVIDVVTRLPLTRAGEEFLRMAADAASQLNVEVRHRQFGGNGGTHG